MDFKLDNSSHLAPSHESRHRSHGGCERHAIDLERMGWEPLEPDGRATSAVQVEMGFKR